MSLVRIDELFKFEKGSLQSSKSVAGNYDFITAAEEWKTHKEYSHECEALIFAAAASGSLGRTHYVNGKFITSDLCFLLTPRDETKYPIDLKFYQIIFQNYKYDIVKNTKAGTSKEAIGLKSFGRYKLPYYDIVLQRELRKRFESSGITKDKLKQQQIRQLDLLKKLRQQILQDAVQGKLVPQDPNDEPVSVLLARINAEKEKLVREKKIKKEKPVPPIKPEEIPFEIPENWRWCRLGEVGNFFRGKSKHRPRNDEKLFTDGKYPFVQTGDVAQSKYNNFLIETFSSSYNEVGLSQSKLWNKGTFCITIAANIAEVGFLNIDACVPDSVVTFSSVPDFSTKYLQYFFQTVKEDIEKFAPATAQKNINLGIIQELIFPLPPKNVQIDIVKKVENLLEICDKLEKTIKQNQKYTQDLLQVALKEALEPQEAEQYNG